MFNKFYDDLIRIILSWNIYTTTQHDFCEQHIDKEIEDRLNTNKTKWENWPNRGK